MFEIEEIVDLKQKPPPKIRGSQWKWRREKIFPKTIIRPPKVPTPKGPPKASALELWNQTIQEHQWPNFLQDGMKENESNNHTYETQDAIQDLFFDMYGLPLSWAKVISEWDTPFGHRWKEVVDYFNELIINPIEKGDIEVL